MTTPITTELTTTVMTNVPVSNLSMVAGSALPVDMTASPATMKIGALRVILRTDIFKIAIFRACLLRDTMSHTSTRQTHATPHAKPATAVTLFALHVPITLFTS